MEPFDISTYLANKAGVVGNDNMPQVTPVSLPEITPVEMPQIVGFPTVADDGLSKVQALRKANEDKQLALAIKTQKFMQKIEAENKNSLVRQIGLDPTAGVGAGINAALGTVGIVGDMAGFTAGLVPSAVTKLLQDTGVMTPAAANKTRAQIQHLKDFISIGKNVHDKTLQAYALEEMVSDPSVQTALGNLKNVIAPSTSEDSNYVSPTGITKTTSKDLQTVVSAAIKSGINNPGAMLGWLAENVPQIALAVYSGGANLAQTFGYAMDNYDKWETDFAKNNKGRNPTEKERNVAGLETSGLFLSELLSDSVTKGLITGTSKLTQPLTEAIGSSLSKATGTITNKGVKSLTDNLVATTKAGIKTGVGSVEGGIGEAPTEGLQTYLEGELTHKPATPEEIFQGAAVGGLVGGVIGGTAPGIKTVANGVASTVAATKLAATGVKAGGDVLLSTVNAIRNKTDKVGAASEADVAAGDISNFIKPDVDPAKNDWTSAAGLLVKSANLPSKTLTDVENTAERIKTEVVTPLEDAIRETKADTVEGRKAFTDDVLTKISRKLAIATDPKEIEDLKADQVVFEKMASEVVPPAADKSNTARLKVLEKQLAEVTGLHQGLLTKTKELSTEASVIGLADEIVKTTPADTTTTDADGVVSTTTATPDVSAKIDALIIRAMRTTGQRTQAMADAIDAVVNSGTATKAQVDALRLVSEDIVASNKLSKSLDTTQNQVLNGVGAVNRKPTAGVDFIGINTRKSLFDQAMDDGNTDFANKQYVGLSKFAKDQANKLAELKKMSVGWILEKFDNGWKARPLTFAEKSDNDLRAKTRANLGFVWDSDPENKGYKKLVANLEESVSIATPIANLMAHKLGHTPAAVAPIVPVAAKPARVILNAPNKKDQAKSDRANKFIGRGVVNSWTHKYAQLWGDRANTGSYEASDVVFISSNGNRPGSVKPDFVEIAKAVAAGATLITDTAAYRKNSSYNVGEREVATFLGNNGYEEDANGTWTPVKVVVVVATAESVSKLTDKELEARHLELLNKVDKTGAEKAEFKLLAAELAKRNEAEVLTPERGDTAYTVQEAKDLTDAKLLAEIRRLNSKQALKTATINELRSLFVLKKVQAAKSNSATVAAATALAELAQAEIEAALANEVALVKAAKIESLKSRVVTLEEVLACLL